MKRTLLYFVMLCSSTLLNAQSFNLFKEINTTATSNAISVIGLAATGNTIFYVATDGVNGNELWKSDGTTAGTFMVKDINPGSASGIILNSLPNSGNSFNAINGILYFLANDGSTGNELWRSDGTNAGTYLIKDITPGSASTTLLRLFFHNGLLFFGATDGVSGLELWKSDGTEAGTVIVKDINPGSAAGLTAMSNPYFFKALGSDIYFPANNGVAGIELWKSDGTNAGTVIVKDIIPGSGSSISTQKAAVFNNKLFFAATNGTAVNGTELWVTDGTDAGTSMVKDIVSGTGNSLPNNLIEFNGSLFFSASSASNANPDIWKTDGTDAGTIMVKNLVADGVTINIGNSAAINEFTVMGSKLFFRINSSPSGSELYATDGTAAGSGIVSDYNSGANGVNPSGLIAFNNNIYFIGTDVTLPGKGSVMYKSDGTAGGTLPLASGVTANILGLSSNYNVIANNRLYFFGNTIDQGIELWSTDGSSVGTTLVKDVNTQKIGTLNSGVNMLGSVVMGGKYYFAAADDDNGMELWKSDGTEAGTVIVKDIWQGKGSSYPSQFTAYNGMIYFMASDAVNGSELWKTDGTEAGTVMIADIAPGAISSSISRITVNNNTLFFSAYHPLYGQEFWRSDGTAAGTSMLVDLVPGAASGITGPNDALSIGSNIYLLANIANGNILGIPQSNRLFKLDAITQTLTEFFPTITASQDIASIGTTLYITGRNAAGNTMLWKSENGGAVTQVKVLSTSAVSAFSLTDCNGKLYFNGSNGSAAGGEPWISDGTEAGTYMIKDLSPGTTPSSPEQFVYSGGKVYFTAITPVGGGHELWATDGTNAGTYLVKDIQAGAVGSRPSGTISIPGNKVLFVANDGVNGNELWQSNGTAAGTTQFPEFNNSGDGAIPANSFFINFPNDFFYPKLNDNIVFFARSADKGMQLYSGNIAGRYKYVNDNSTSNDIFTTAVGNNANNGSQSAPYATVSYAISQAQAGDTIYVDAGVFFEQVTIDKGITLVGAGSGLTIIWKPAVTNPPPGPFIEQGTIQSVQNIGDVHIRDMSVTGDGSVGVTPIILQTGGSVKNCRLIGGSQGIFFRVESAVKSALIENNFINIEYIGINCQGSGLTATLTNNTIDLTNPFFAAGVFAGLDFGPLVRFTATGNIINNYNAQGFLANSYNTYISQNSIVGTGSHAIEQSTNSLGIATCNWFGTTNAATIASKVSGLFSYTPFLTNGTNTNTTYGNYSFVPVAGACGEGGNSFYVNDNSLTGNIFTTGAGNNANSGTPASPLATITEALTRAVAGDIIYVDAGSYTEAVDISKNITIRGAGMGITILNGPSTHIAPLPGSGESGIIQTISGLTNVIIEGITIDGTVSDEAHGIFIQGGGRVSNCELRYVNDGIYFQYISAESRAVISNNNYVHHINYVGSLFAGNGMSVTASNNLIDLSGAISGMGFIAGYGGGGNLASFTATNNSIINFASFGMMVGSLQTAQVHNNSLTRIAGNFLQSAHININATCNWYGTADAGVIIPNMSGANYSSWLSNGTDVSTAIGFQAMSGVCNGRQNKFYVNDNSLTGDVFSTGDNPVGNDANPGVPSAPLLTIDAALTRASAGDTIFVDAGTYATPNLNISKSVTILGSNYNASPNNPADRLAINPVRNDSTIITGSTFTIASNDVRLEGLNFKPGAKSQVVIASTGANNFVFKRNHSIVSTTAFLNLYVSSVPNGQVSPFGNYLIEDNRFESNVISNSICIAVGALNDVTINNNTFFTPPTSSPRLMTSCIPGQVGGLTVNFLYTNNISNSARNEVFTSTPSIASARIENNISLDGQRAILIQINGGASSDIQIRNNYIESSFADISPIQYRRDGTALPNALASAIIEDNTIIQNPAGRTTITAGITAHQFFTAANSSTTIRRNKISFVGDHSSLISSSVFGITMLGGLLNLDILDNEITFNGTNLTNTIPATGPSSSGIYISPDNGSNFIPANAVLNVTGNKINGFSNSIVVYDASAAAPNTFVGYGNLLAGVTLNINNNSLTGGLMAINNGTTGQSANATCNWYGSASAQNIINKISLATVDIAPWLTNGTDNDVATGFQPVPGSCDGYPTLITLDNYTDVSCNGAANGSINITTSYGKAPFTYTWTKDGDPGFISHAEDPTNLAPGTYHLSIVDGNGSNIYVTSTEADGPGTIDVTITEPSLLTASASGSNNLCFGQANGSAAVLAEGGTAPYTYLWSNGATTDEISNLTAGLYTVTVTDDNGCTAQASYTVTQPALLTANATGTTTVCSSSASVVANGGAGSYTYLWSNGATSQTISNLLAGTYNVTVTDANGCTVIANCTVTAAEAYNSSAQVTNVSCYGGSNGVIEVTNANGTAPFQYSIDNGLNFQGSNIFSGLFAGTYTITVKDANGCTGFVTKTITQPTQLVATLNTVQSTCFGLSNGSISVTVSGGTSSYNYQWTGPNSFSSTQLSVSNLAAGPYTLTVTDNKGCIVVLPVVVPTYNQITTTPVVSNISCKGAANGSIVLNTTGGTGNFSYSWNTGQTSGNIFNLVKNNNYKVTITDIGSGCTLIQTFGITEPSTTVSITTPSQNIINVSGCVTLGSLKAVGAGGTPFQPASPYYLYSINGTNYQTSQTFSNLNAGVYTVWVKDANGCTATKPVTIGDTGSDEYESTGGGSNNNSKNKAAPINIGPVISARLSSGDEDWFKFTPSVTATYRVTFNAPLPAHTYQLKRANLSVPGFTQITSSPLVNEYAILKKDSVYYLTVAGGPSSTCYTISVAMYVPSGMKTDLIVKENPSSEADQLGATVYPNPHRGKFNLLIDSPEEGNAVVQIIASDGRLIANRNVIVRKGKVNIIEFNNMQQTILFYRIIINNKTATGKIIGPD